jgi:hypothetical protein
LRQRDSNVVNLKESGVRDGSYNPSSLNPG